MYFRELLILPCLCNKLVSDYHIHPELRTKQNKIKFNWMAVKLERNSALCWKYLKKLLCKNMFKFFYTGCVPNLQQKGHSIKETVFCTLLCALKIKAMLNWLLPCRKAHFVFLHVGNVFSWHDTVNICQH